MDRLFKFLSSKENDTVRPKILTIKGRNVTFEKTCGQIVDCTFDELCDRVSCIIFILFKEMGFRTVNFIDFVCVCLALRCQRLPNNESVFPHRVHPKCPTVEFEEKVAGTTFYYAD